MASMTTRVRCCRRAMTSDQNLARTEVLDTGVVSLKGKEKESSPNPSRQGVGRSDEADGRCTNDSALLEPLGWPNPGKAKVKPLTRDPID
jgi:hypothetical protein